MICPADPACGRLVFFPVGISAGIFTELMMTSAEKEGMISYLDQYFCSPAQAISLFLISL
jgi:hypothetical protein